MEINEIYNEVLEKFNNHIRSVYKSENNLIMISQAYKGVWLEHVYDSLVYAKITGDYKIAKNTILEFIKYQKENGQLPYSIKDDLGPQFFQIQECVSFVRLSYLVYQNTRDLDFLNKIYNAGRKWVSYIKNTRENRYHLIEMFIGYDTGHDNSGRLDILEYPKNYKINGVAQVAEVIPKTNRTRVIALDMSCNFYSNLKYMSLISKELGYLDEAKNYLNESLLVKEDIFKYLYDKKTNFFYDLDLEGNFNYVKSSSIFHLFQEEVLDKENDFEMIENIYKNYLKNPNEFWAPYPIPSVSLSEPSRKTHKIPNSWGYYSQALIQERCLLWMDNYGFSKDYDYILKKWVEGFIKNYEEYPVAQELDPISGESSGASINYSTSSLLFIYAVKRLKLI